MCIRTTNDSLTTRRFNHPSTILRTSPGAQRVLARPSVSPLGQSLRRLLHLSYSFIVLSGSFICSDLGGRHPLAKARSHSVPRTSWGSSWGGKPWLALGKQATGGGSSHLRHVTSGLQELRHYHRTCRTITGPLPLTSVPARMADPLQRFLLLLVFPFASTGSQAAAWPPGLSSSPLSPHMGKVHIRTASAPSPLAASVRMALSSLHHWSSCSLALSTLVLVCNSQKLPNPSSPRFPKLSHPYTDGQLACLLSSPPCLKAISDPQI